MADVNLYFYIEDLNLTVAQRNELIRRLQLIGRRDNDDNPKNRNHWRIRLDNKAAIFEAWFDENHLTVTAIKNVLADIYSISASLISHSVVSTSYGPAVTYSYNSVARVRFGVFNGVSASYKDSQASARAYLKENASAWNVSN